MLRVVLDNDSRALAMRAVQLLALPADDPFVPDTLVVGQIGTGIWLEQQLARHSGISANLRVTLPGSFIWQSVEQQVRTGNGPAKRPPFDPMTVRWAVLDALEHTPAAGPGLAQLSKRWADAPDADRMLLASSLAQTFERYLAYRRNWLAHWAEDRAVPAAEHASADAATTFAMHEPWQRWLWQQILSRIAGLASTHPFDELREQMLARRGAPDESQPDLFDPVEAPPVDRQSGRIVLFGLLDIPTEQMQMLALLARSNDVVWFAPDPAQGFWEDLVSPAVAARIALESPESAWLYEHEPVVLGEWGRQHRDFLARLRQLQADHLLQIQDQSLRERDVPASRSRLQALQNAVFSLSDAPWDEYFAASQAADRAADPTLEVHSAHSLMRQVEVAHDRIRAALDETDDLRADDVAIFCTDIAQAAPLIHSIFESSATPAIQIQVSGLGGATTPQVNALIDFLALAQGPATLGAVLAWFESELPRQVCRLDDQLLSRLRQALIESAALRDDIGADGDGTKHGWRNGLDRLLLGAFTGWQQRVVVGHTMAGGNTDSSLAGALGHLQLLLDDIRHWRRGAGQPRPVAAWADMMLDWANRWLSPYGPSRDGLLRVQQAIAQVTESTASLHTQVRNRPVSFATYAQALRGQFAHGAPAARTSGAVTVAPLGSLRSVPFRLCVLLAMEQDKWPPGRRRPEYDLMRSQPQFGDRSPGAEARGVYLDAILDTSERLIITYTGHDIRTNDAANPSRMVTELSDYLLARAKAQAAQETALPATAEFLYEHVLQPFSPRRFEDSRVPSYAHAWFDAARVLAGGPGVRSPVGSVAALPVSLADAPAKPLPPTLRIDQVVDALLEPAKVFLREAGGIAITASEIEADELEPLERAGLGFFDDVELVDQATRMLRAGTAQAEVGQWLIAHPLTPAGNAGRQATGAMLKDAVDRLTRENKLLGQLGLTADASGTTDRSAGAAVAVPVHVPQLGQTLVTGRLEPVYQVRGTPVQVLAPAGQATVRAVVKAWCAHLLLANSTIAGAANGLTICPLLKPFRATGAQPVEMICFRASAVNAANMHDAVVLYAQIRDAPQPLFERTGTAWLTRSDDLSGSRDASFKAYSDAEKIFSESDVRRPAENTRPWPVALWRESAPPFDLVLKRSLQVYGPLWLAGLTGVPDIASIGQ